MKNFRCLIRLVRRSVLTFLFVGVLCFHLTAQKSFIPFKVSEKDSLLEQLVNKRFNAEKDTIRFPEKEGKAFITEQCSLRSEYIKSALKDEMFLTGSFIDQYVQKIVAEIERANSTYKGRITVRVSRDPEPNAYALGNGIVVFNIGMLYQVTSEAEIAFILCHEFAHDIFQHSNESIYTTAYRVSDDELKKQLEETVKEEYNVKKKVIALLMPGLKKSRQYSRALELQADSMGLALLKNTKYSVAGAVNGMDVLDAIDVWDKNKELTLKSFFTIPQVPLNGYLFEYSGESSLGGGFTVEKDSLADSLKTHPDCKVRKEALQKMAGTAGIAGLFLQPEEDFKRMKFETDGELIQLLLDWQNVDYSVYYSLYSLEKYPSGYYAKSVLSLSLAFLSKEKKNLSSSKYMRYNGPDYSDNFNRLLYFLTEINPEDCASLAYWMLRPANSEEGDTEIHLAAMTLSAYCAGKNDEYLALRTKYDTVYPEGRYVDFLPRKSVENKKKK